MTIRLLQIGKTNKDYWKEAIQEYEKRLGKYVKFDILTLSEPKKGKNLSPKEIKKKEGEELMKHLMKSDYIVLLDEKGKEYRSKEFADKLEKLTSSGKKDISFVIGGAYGISEELKEKADEQIALSKMTFSHQMIRPVFMEQLYRAFTILRGEPYHN